MSANLNAVQVRPAAVGDVSRGLITAVGTMFVEVALGACLLVLFVLALAWDPIDRKIGARGKRIAERSRKLNPSAPEGTYAILPAD